MKKRKLRKPAPHPFAFMLHDEIFIVESAYGLTPNDAKELAAWLLKAAAWLRKQESK